jgi:hypothetical protein
MAEWKPLSAGCRDDGLDAAAGALSLEPVRIPKTFSNARRLWHAGGDGHAAYTDFDV